MSASTDHPKPDLEGEPEAKRAKTELSEEVRGLVDQWLAWDTDAETRAEISVLAENGDEEELRDRLCKRISFGTAGLRAAMKAGFKYMNNLIVQQTAQGICSYLESTNPDVKEQGVVVGYDGRYNSKSYAEVTARVFVSHGIPVYLLSKTLVATPFVPFCIVNKGAAAGIMVTASHNPKSDNGYKVYWGNGCQIIPPIDGDLSREIRKCLEPWEIPATVEGNDLVSDPSDEISAAYYDHIQNQLCFFAEDNSTAAEPIVYTAMHGVGTPWVLRAFETFGLPPPNCVEQQCFPDPEFSTVTFPNPEEGKGTLTLSIELAEKVGARVILANDPDADRLAVAERQEDGSWYVFNGNELGIILANWTWTQFRAANPDVAPADCAMITTAVSSRMLAAYCEKEGISFDETLTGFKWMGNKALERINEGKTFLFAYEEAIGFQIRDACLDKDGVRTAAVFAEMVNQYNKQSLTLMDQLGRLYETYGYFIIRTRYFFCYEPTVMAAIFDALRKDENYPSTVGDYEVIRVRDQTTGYDSRDGKTVLPVTPNGQMLTFWFKDGYTVTLRGSGTEPKLKYYIEAVSPDGKEAASQILEALTEAVVANLLRPEENGLVAPSAS